MTTIRLTMAQALTRHLAVQTSEVDGREVPLFAGVFAIFGHGNVAGIGEALYDTRERLPTSSDPLRRRFYQSFFEELRRLGDIEGQNLVIERYSGEGWPEGLPDPIDLAPSFARRRSTQAEKLHWPLKQPNQLFNRAIALCRNAG